MQEKISEPELSAEQQGLLDERLQATDEAAQELVDAFADNPDLKFVPNPSLIGDGINIIDNSGVIPRTQPSAAQIKHIKRMMAGPMMREKQPCKKFISRCERDKKRRLQKRARRNSR